MTARLQRFYGGDPAWWLFTAPLALLRAYMAMLTRLVAEEALETANVTALGSGTMKRESAAKFGAALRRTANPRRGKRAGAIKNPAMLARMGIAVVEAEPAGGEGPEAA